MKRSVYAKHVIFTNFFTFIFSLNGLADTLKSQETFDLWLNSAEQVAIWKLRQNSSAPDTLPGTIIASPSKSHPDYFYHWTRDASLSALTMIRMYESGKYNLHDQFMLKTLKNFARLSKQHQNTSSPAGHGEPKFHVSGEPYTGPWGRPQNDGPALRSLALIRLATVLLNIGEESFVRSVLYDGNFPSTSVIKSDLEYLSLNWQLDDFDLWEEVKGTHLFTRVAQAKAFESGARLAETLRDPQAAFWYRIQAEKIRSSLKQFKDPASGLVLSTVNRSGGIDYKGGLDASLILAILVDSESGKISGITNKWTDRSILALKEKFLSIYPINTLASQNIGIAMGRYPEDTYDGYQTGKSGNPWFILTLALGEYHFQKAKSECLSATGSDAYILARDHFIKGNAQLMRVKIHQDSEFNMDEQFNKTTGYMQGARDLTWSYTSLLNSLISRSDAKHACHF